MKLRQPVKYILGLFALLSLLFPIIAQVKQAPAYNVKQAILDKNYVAADSLWHIETKFLLAEKKLDSLTEYVKYRGHIIDEIQGKEKAKKAVLDFINLIQSKKATAMQMAYAYYYAAEYFKAKFDFETAYSMTSKELENAYLLPPEDRLKELAFCEYNLGAYAYYLTKINLSKKHHYKALSYKKNIQGKDKYKELYLSYNAIASCMWYESKYDSANYYYEEAMRMLKKMPPTGKNKYYRVATIKNNISALYSILGKTSEAIKANEEAIELYQQYIKSGEISATEIASCNEAIYEAVDNLAARYREMGSYAKAGNLLNYSYHQKKTKLSADYPGTYLSEILIGQHYKDTRNYDSAAYYLKKGISHLEDFSNEYKLWIADGWFHLAEVYVEKDMRKEAAEAFEKSHQLFKLTYGNMYDEVYLDFLRRLSLFYAANQEYQKAIAIDQDVRKYLTSVKEIDGLQGFYQLINTAKINYLNKRYKESIVYADQALELMQHNMQKSETVLDSIKIEIYKPLTVLLKTKSLYAIQKEKDTVFLKKISLALDDAIQTLNKRKLFIDDAASNAIIIENHKELVDFAIKIALALENATGKTFYIDKIIHLSESGLYTKIRNRIHRANAIAFSNVPPEVLAKESTLLANMKNAIKADSIKDNAISNYIQAEKNWKKHLQELKTLYPKYYNLRYATSTTTSLKKLQQSLPKATTIIRYIFVDSGLIGIVINKDATKVIPLQDEGLENKIEQLLLRKYNEKKQLTVLHEIYNQIWHPLTPYINTHKVIIIPDGVLYNIGFDMLPVVPVSAFNDLIDKSLLAKHTLSYHYSLQMLHYDDGGKKAAYNYIAFAPGFSDELKNKYLSNLPDSLQMDIQYLHLLPQPSTVSLANNIKSIVGGSLFTNLRSTKTSFIQNAKGHKIIHIATHAVYDNIHPENSRLIFAKNNTASATNYLSLKEIFNCNMQSDLTILTACESGRPGYQDGEGMVSMAHAFHYAGSETVLTALWKVDEQSSSIITKSFIENIQEGLPTDEALRKAKLDYLKNIQSNRLSDPGYWAGLVLMGKPQTIDLGNKNTPLYGYLLAGGLFTALLSFFIMTKKRAKAKAA